MISLNLAYISIRDEYQAIVDKTKAYETTYKELSDQLKHHKQGKSWKIRSMFQKAVVPSTDSANLQV
jgi:hypothetical protein